MLRTPVSTWKADFDGIYSGKEIFITPEDYDVPADFELERRVIRGTKVIFIGDYEKVLEMQQDVMLYHDLCNKATVKVNNPDYLDFEVYTRKILQDPLKNIFDMQSVTPEQAKKYMDYAVLYEKDKVHSDKLIIKPYFASCDAGILILSEDFVDYNVDLDVVPDIGVVGIKVWQSENTSKYIKNYVEV